MKASVKAGAFILPGRKRGLKPLADQQASPLVVIQRKVLDGYGFGPLAIRRFDRAEIFALAADEDDAPASQIGGGGLLFGALHRRGTGRREHARTLDSTRVNRLERSDAPTGRQTAGCLSIRIEPALPDWRYPRFRSFQDRAACYHFATQLDGTGQNGAVWPCAYGAI